MVGFCHVGNLPESHDDDDADDDDDVMMTGMHTCQDRAGSGTRGLVLGNPPTFWEQARYLISIAIYMNFLIITFMVMVMVMPWE